MIPKKIHYCWFGYGDKPQEVKDCIHSWRKYLPEWQIQEWNEQNYDITKHPYMKEAYEAKKWAYVSDMARLDILYNQGGVYLDVDVEFVKPLPLEYLKYEGFCGFEHTTTVAPGLIFGIEPGHPFLKRVLDSYAGEHFQVHKNGIYTTINMRITEILKEYGLVKKDEFQNVGGIRVFPSEFFCGYDTDVREPAITDNTICWHHYLGSWSHPSWKMRCQNYLKKIIGVKNYRRILMLVRKCGRQ